MCGHWALRALRQAVIWGHDPHCQGRVRVRVRIRVRLRVRARVRARARARARVGMWVGTIVEHPRTSPGP